MIIVFVIQTESSSSFLRAARAGNLEKLLEYLKGKMDINTCNAVRAFIRSFCGSLSSEFISSLIVSCSNQIDQLPLAMTVFLL